MDDCDMYGTDFEDFFLEQSKNASTLGHVGILIDMPSNRKETKQEEIDDLVYPYFAVYKPMNILDWEWNRDDYGRPYLAYLKLLDDDGYYRIWTMERWEVWEIIEGDGATEIDSTTEVYRSEDKVKKMGRGAVKVRDGANPLGEIPFAFLFNQRSSIDPEVGVSDIVDTSRIDASIIRNLSQIEEIINYAAFPMMRKPMKEAGAGADVKDETGVTSILEFNPENPESKPDWLNSVVGEPVNATLEVIKQKISEIYRSANVGGMNAMEIANQAKSGVALKAEFQMLNSKIVKKSKALAQVKKQCVDFWYKWQGVYDQFAPETVFDYVKTYEIEDLATDLENLLTAGAIVTGSTIFSAEQQKLTVRLVLASAEDEVINAIDEEIEENMQKQAEMQDLYFEQQRQITAMEGDQAPDQIPNAEVVEGEANEEE
jgi:hypothetical protein